VALSRVYLQLAMSPAPTNVTVAAFATCGVLASNAAMHDTITAKAIEARSRLVFLTLLSLPLGRSVTSPALCFPNLPCRGA
jgi:hypothetical protein